ncbi:hypothetical protein ABIA42_006821 [Bradyrhizobium sp. USDA 327]
METSPVGQRGPQLLQGMRETDLSVLDALIKLATLIYERSDDDRHGDQDHDDHDDDSEQCGNVVPSREGFQGAPIEGCEDDGQQDGPQ